MPYKDKNKQKENHKIWRESHREHLKIYREENKEKIKESSNKSYLKNRNVRIIKQREYYEENGKQQNAKCLSKKRDYQEQYTQNPDNQLKIEARIITRPIIVEGLCEICQERPATEKHHPDYNNPNQIQFICSSCHRQIHGYGLIMEVVK
jgi:hypothetical protein